MANSVAPPNVIAPRYQARFACIGAACEDTCCAGWSISVDADHFRKMRAALGKSKEDRATFEASVKPVQSNATRSRYALVVLNGASGRCNFLEDSSLCMLHARHGEWLLPDTCATYPRRQSIVRTPDSERLEVACVMSCPEAARLALLSKDAMELVDVQRQGMIVREHWMQLNDPSLTKEIYDAALDIVRGALLQIISGAPSLTAGLATCAALADQLGPAFGRNVPTPIHPDTLLAMIAEFSRPEISAQMEAELRKIDVPLTVPMLPLLQVLSTRFELAHGHFSILLKNAVNAFGISQNTIVADVARAYEAERDAVGPLVESRLNELLLNYVLQHVFSYWYTHASNLGIYVRGLFLRVAFLRFLTFAHPDIIALKNGGTESDAARTVERVVVEVVYKMTRDIDHHGPFVLLLDQVLPAALPGLEHALTLLKL